MGLFGTLIKSRIPASSGGLTTQPTGIPGTPSTPAGSSRPAGPASLTIPVLATGTSTGGTRGVAITLIPVSISPIISAGTGVAVAAASSAATAAAALAGASTLAGIMPGIIAGGTSTGTGVGGSPAPMRPLGAGGLLAGSTGGSSGGPSPDSRLGSSIAHILGNTAGPLSAAAQIDLALATIFPGTGGASNNIIRRLPTPSGDVINVAETRVQNGQFTPIMDSGVHKFRPEIILNTEFNTIWEPGVVEFRDDIRGNRQLKKQSPTGDYINFQFQTKQLRQETLGGLIKNIQNTLGDPDIFKDVKKEYTNQLAQAGNDLKYLENIVANIEVIKNAFNIKNIPIENYESRSGDSTIKTRTLRQVFNEKMQYRTEQFDNFSSTKIMLQLLFDLENMLSSYSVGLLNLTDTDRANDNSPDVLDRTYTTKNGNFSFSIKNFSSMDLENAVNAADSSFFTTFMSSLPPGPNDRIKLLTYLLAKEYSVSRGLGNRTNLVRLQAAQYNTRTGGSPFKNAIGIPGSTIFENSFGVPDSLASLMYVNPNTPNVRILTFEHKYIDSNDQTFTYIPGAAFFTDSILTVDGKAWDSNALTTYINRYNSIVRSVRTLISDVFSFDESATATSTGISGTESSVIDPVEMNKRLLLAVKSSYGILSPAQASGLEDLTNFGSAAVQKKLLLEEQINSINGYIELAGTSEAQRAAYNSQIVAIRAKIDVLNLPAVDSSLNVSLDKATVMALFKFVSSGHDDLKLQLFRFCLLAAMTRNSPDSNLNDIFSLIASNEIDNTNKLASADPIRNSLRGSNQSTDNGTALVPLLSRCAVDLSIKLRELLGSMEVAGRQFTPEGTLKYYIQESSIATLLYQCARGEGPAAEQNLIYQFVNLVNQFFNSGRMDGQNTHIINLGPAATRYNYLSCSTQALFVFEILCQYASVYGPAKFTSHDLVRDAAPEVVTVDSRGTVHVSPPPGGGGRTTGDTHAGERSTILTIPAETINTFGISINYTQMNSVAQAINLLTTSATEEEKDATRKRNNRAFLDLEANKNKIAAEYETIKEMIQNLKIIGDHLQASLTQVQSFFGQKELQDFLKKSPATNLNLLKNYSQLRLASYIYNDIKERSNAPSSFMKNFGGSQSTQGSSEQSDLIVSETTTDSEYNALVSFLSDANNPSLQCMPSDSHPADVIKRNNKILAIGIPAGFSRELADRVNIAQINAQTFQDKQSDVVIVKVFIRNLKFADLAFKPLEYIFDLSLFATRKDFVDCNAVHGESIETILDRISLTDLDSPFSPQKIDASMISADSKYNFLTSRQRGDLIKNHVASYLLSMYIQYITGVKTTEEIFLIPSPPPKQLSTKARIILDTYIKKTYGILPGIIPIKDILISKNLPENLKDAYRLLTYGSLVFCDNEIRSKILTPKLFDRVFYVPVNIDNAEIDMAATRGTAVGRTALSKEDTNKYFRMVPPGTSGPDTQYFLDAYDIDDFIINDIFIAVETANDTVAQDITAANTPRGFDTGAGISATAGTRRP